MMIYSPIVFFEGGKGEKQSVRLSVKKGSLSILREGLRFFNPENFRDIYRFLHLR